VIYNGGRDEGLPYYDFKYCASKSAEAANSSFCIFSQLQCTGL
jgi:hypothetical protein